MCISNGRSALICDIKAAMVRKNMTQADLAKALDVSENTVSAKMQGKSEFTIPQARVLVRLLDLSPLIFFPDYAQKMEQTA